MPNPLMGLLAPEDPLQAARPVTRQGLLQPNEPGPVTPMAAIQAIPQAMRQMVNPEYWQSPAGQQVAQQVTDPRRAVNLGMSLMGGGTPRVALHFNGHGWEALLPGMRSAMPLDRILNRAAGPEDALQAARRLWPDHDVVLNPGYQGEIEAMGRTPYIPKY